MTSHAPRSPLPNCWGYHGLPLWPGELSSVIPADATVTSGGAPHERMTKAAMVLEDLLRSDRVLCAGVPVLPEAPADLEALAGVPFLRRTRAAAESAGISFTELTHELPCLSLADVADLTVDAVAVLDLCVTARSWVDVTGPEPFVTQLSDELTPAEFGELAVAALFRERGMKDDRGWAGALAARWGWSGRSQLTLEQAGDLVGVTRERVRQVASVVKPVEGWERVWPAPPSVTSALDTLLAALPEERTVLDERLAANHGVTCDGLVALAELCGRRVDLDVGDVVLGRDHAEARRERDHRMEVMTQTIRDLSGANRLANLRAVVRNVAERGFDLEIEDARSLCASDDSLWLLPLDYVFHDTSYEAPPFNEARRMIDFAGPLPLEVVVEGIDRAAGARQRPPMPPRSVVRALFERHPGFSVDPDDTVASLRESGQDDSILQVQIARFLAGRAAECATVDELHDEARRRSWNWSSVQVYLQFSSLIRKAGPSTYAPVGVEVPPEVVSEVRDRTLAQRIAAHVSHRYEAERVVIDVVVGTATVTNGVLTVPQELASAIGDRRFRATADDGTSYGHLGVSGSNLYGLTGLLKHYRVSAGDRMVIVLDASTGSAAATVDGGNGGMVRAKC